MGSQKRVEAVRAVRLALYMVSVNFACLGGPSRSITILSRALMAKGILRKLSGKPGQVREQKKRYLVDTVA